MPQIYRWNLPNKKMQMVFLPFLNVCCFFFGAKVVVCGLAPIPPHPTTLVPRRKDP